ncbi:HEPN domain-containing protein [Reyranella sp.]|uniref:HEPN domain-containing protein n=1 Tax=Reyranella sp. TaxID=1929291 RepID=UPI00271AAD70|nr:HEPN domain-containing protein [Reyranella sp.]MDO8977550.1 HEPN domain-containing protein [Reyranella sp.]
MSDEERTHLVRVLREAIAADEPTTLIGRPSSKYRDIAKAGIEVCASFTAIENQNVYSALSLIPVHSDYLSRVIYFHGETAEEQADWLLRMMRTTVADGYFVAAIWGIALTETIDLSPTARLIPFSELRESVVKRILIERAKRRKTVSHWLASHAFQVPSAAYVELIKDVPYIGLTARSDEMVVEAFERGVSVWPLVEMLGAGRSLVFASWFEYVDETLDVSAYENHLSFYHPEVAPYLDRPIPVDAEQFRAELAAFAALPGPARARLIRAAKRFSLSLCRFQIIDRTLDLALGFEIMLSGGSESVGGTTWKLAVRCAQLVGGDLEDRIRIRKQINDFYQHRSRASHGSEPDIPQGDVDAATELFKQTFRALVRLGKEPIWNEIELGSAHR